MIRRLLILLLLGGALLALTVRLEAQTAPSITTQPAAVVAVDPGATATFTVVATGTAPLSYQWMKDAVPIAGATSSTFVITGVIFGRDFGTYTVVVSNSSGSVTSQNSDLRVNAAPYFISSPASQTVVAGTSYVSFNCLALGWPLPNCQWMKNGVPIPGATSDGGLQLYNVTTADTGDYTMTATNVYGTVVSATATLTVTGGLVIASEPTDQTVIVNQGASFSVGAILNPSASYQWQSRADATSAWVNLANPGVYTGITSATLTLASTTLAMDGMQFRCVVTNSAGTEASSTATLHVNSLVYLGGYFGALDSGGGHWALYANGATSTFLAYLPDRHSAIVQTVAIAPDGSFTATGTEAVATGTTGAAFTLTGQISAGPQQGQRTVAGQLAGLGHTFTGAFPTTGGQTQASGDFYTALALKGDQGKVYSIIGYDGSTLAVVATPSQVDGVLATVGSTGATTSGLSATTAGGAALTLAVDVTTHIFTATFTPAGTGVRSLSFRGLGESVASTARLTNVSVRSAAGTGDQTLIVGLVVSGSDSKQLLLRGIGPTLATYGVSGAMADPQLLLFNAAGSLINSNNDWGGGSSLQGIFQTLGAFALDPASKDAALSLALSGGVYSAHVASTTAQNGIALLEVYDADANHATRLVNLSARTTASSGSGTLIAGFVITGNAPLQVLIRGVGPTLSGFGVGGALADPLLQLYDASGQLMVQNDDWGGASFLSDAFAKVGAFPLASATSKDAALLVTLSPGVYSAQVSGVGGTSGIALIEIYEVP